jgi:hypothetical protein
MAMKKQPAEYRMIATRPVDKWLVGVDLGQSIDSTAIVVLHHTVKPLDKWTSNAKAETWREDSVQRFDIMYLQRLPLGMSYVAQVQQIAEMLEREPLKSANPALVCDQTGVGAGVIDLIENAGLRPNRIVITSGTDATQHGACTWHVPKQLLVSRLEAAMHSSELHAHPDMREFDALRDELQDFQGRNSATGKMSFSAKSGAHDDILMSCAMVVWFACNRPYVSIEPLNI